jgi:hypothetical protein
MKRTRGNRTGIRLVSCSAYAFQAAVLELSTRFDLGNLAFDPDRAAADATFSGAEYYWGGTVEVTHGFSERMALRAGFTRDTVLRNLAYAMIYYNLDSSAWASGPSGLQQPTGPPEAGPGLSVTLLSFQCSPACC